MSDPAHYEFGPFRLDLARRELLARGAPVTLGQRAFDVLVALVRRQGQLVTKDELLSEVWPRLVVEENNLQVQVSTLRRIFQTVDGGERYLVTVAGRGYRFVAPVRLASPAAPAADATDRAADQGLAPRPGAGASNLPEPLTPLIGREAEIDTVIDRLATHRLVTLTGAGGVGKTRLAIEAGRRIAPRYADGVWFVELAPLGDRRLVLSVVAEALRSIAGGAKGGLDELTDALKARRMLLILDNCEHVLDEATRVAQALLRVCPRLTLLASSREPFGIAGESVFRVPSLPAPEPGISLGVAAARRYPAVLLFEQRAGALGIDFAVAEANVGLVSAICRSLDGIPLAIELAVPRLRVLSLAQLARGLDDRLALLRAGCRTAPPRHQTLQALIDWSYQPLDAVEKLFVQRFAVFAGSAALETVRAVVAEGDIAPARVLDVISSLVEKSLIVADLAGGEPRYRMLESTRLFAQARLAKGGEGELRRRHARHFAARLGEAGTAWETAPSRAWTAGYAGDVDNVRAALDWAFAPGGDAAIGLDLVGRGHVLWAELGLIIEHRHWVNEALRRCTPQTPAEVVARLLSWQAGDVKDMDDPAEQEDALRAAKFYRELGDAFSEGKMLLRAGTARLLPENAAEGEDLLRQARALLQTAGSTKSLARCLSALATARLLAGDAAGARELHAHAVAIYRRIEEPGNPASPAAKRIEDGSF